MRRYIGIKRNSANMADSTTPSNQNDKRPRPADGAEATPAPSERTLAILRQYARCCKHIPVLKHPLTIINLN